jgi:pimeloyl-ACP methyl ester carboxylesterase
MSTVTAFVCVDCQDGLLSFDLVGFGDSDKPRDFSYQQRDQALLLAQAVARWGLEHFHLVCHSMGGIIGIYLTELAGDQVLSFVNAGGVAIARGPTLLPCLVQDREEVGNDTAIHDQKRNLGPRHATRDLKQFKGDVDAARQKTEPFGPMPPSPQAICFDEACPSVENGGKRQCPKLTVSDAIGQIEKYSGIAAGRIQMKMSNKLLGSEMEIPMDVCQQAESGQ